MPPITKDLVIELFKRVKADSGGMDDYRVIIFVSRLCKLPEFSGWLDVWHTVTEAGLLPSPASPSPESP